MDKLEIKQGSFIQQTQYFIPMEIDFGWSLIILNDHSKYNTTMTNIKRFG
jgi:hypothetical protein